MHVKRNATQRIHQPASRDKAVLWSIIETGKHPDGRQVKQFEAYHAAEILKEIDPDGVREYMMGITRTNPRDKDGVLRLGTRMKVIDMKLKPALYGFRIDLHERGEFRAAVQREDGEDVYAIENNEDGEIPEVVDGWMTGIQDLWGLADYLTEMGVIASGSVIYPFTKAEAFWESGKQYYDEKRTRHNPSQHFIVGVTYATYTEESIENGDAEDRGWESEKEPMELRDALAVLNRYGPYDNIDDRGDSFIAYHSDVQENYRTGEQIAYDVVVEGSAANLTRLLAAYDKKWKRNGKRTRKNPSNQIMLSDREDLDWLREGHLASCRRVPDFEVAVLSGNEDWPTSITLYETDHFNSRTMTLIPDADGVFHCRSDRY